MIYWLKRIIKNNENLYYLAKCLKKICDKDFKRKILYGNEKKNNFEINGYGNLNFGKTIYNINIEDGGSGFFALLRSVLQGLYCAKRGGFIPYVYVHRTAYNLDVNDNMFEYYFLQPANMNSSIVKESAFVAEYNNEHRRWVEELVKINSSLSGGYDFDEFQLDELAKIWKEFIKIKNEVAERLRSDTKKIFDECKIVAVHYRGNAYSVGFYGHPVSLKVEDYFDFLNKCLSIGFEKIFIATDDGNALDRFIERYGDVVVYYRDTERSRDGIDIQNKINRNTKSGYEIGYEVLRDMYTMAECNGFICGKSQVSIATIIKKKADGGKFEYFKLIDKGLYGAENQKSVDNYLRKVKL